MLKIFSGTANTPLAEAICSSLGQKLGKIYLGNSPDGEHKVEVLESVQGQDVFVVQPTCPSVNDNLMQLLIILDALKRSSPSRITAVIPYYGYARQDRKHGPREPISAKLIADLLSVAGPSRVLLLDVHATQLQGFFDIPCDDLRVDSLIRDYLSEKELTGSNTTLVAVNAGGARRVRRVARQVNAKIALVEARTQGEKRVLNVVGSITDNCLIIDDMLDSGNRVCAAADVLKQTGAKRVYLWATHAVLSGNVDHLQASELEEIAVTDSIPIPENKVIDKLKVRTVAPLVAEAIRRIHNAEPMNELFHEP